MNAVLALALAAALMLVVVWVIAKKRRGVISPAAKVRIQKQWEAVLRIEDQTLRVLEADKVLSAVFVELKLEGGFVDQMKAIEARLGNAQSVWGAHKLRNRIAHESGIEVTAKEASVAVKAIGKAMKRLLS